MISRKENFFNPMLKICFIFIAQTCRLNPICPKFRTRETIPRSFRRKCRSRVQFIISMPIYILKCAETLILYILDNRSRYRDRKKRGTGIFLRIKLLGEKSKFYMRFRSITVESVIVATESNGQTRCNNYSSPLVFPHYSF